MSINSDNKISLKGIYKIEVNNCKDLDYPLKYSFNLYETYQKFKDEIDDPLI